MSSLDWARYSANLLRGSVSAGNPERTERMITEVVDRMQRENLRFGRDTSCWHEMTRWCIENDDRPECPICGAKVDGGATVHELCRLRKERGLPTPRLNTEIVCQCYPCRKARGEAR